MSTPHLLRSRTFAHDRRTWIATITLSALVWIGTSAWLNRRVALAERADAPASDDGRFVVLAYDRVVPVPDGRNLDRTRLREQLRGLAHAGWQPVTLQDLRRAYRGGARLPARPLLVTFDEGYLGTYEAADPVLRELRWPAVMFLKTDRQELRDVSFLFWDRLQRMAQSGLWDIASGDPAPPRDPGAAAELPDLPPGALLISSRLDVTAGPAWAPRGVEPMAALGFPAHDRSVPWLGFVDDPVGANDPASDPFRVARVRVDPNWTTPELVRRVEIAVTGASEGGGAPAWVPGQGTFDDGSGVIRLDGHPRADVWIPATRWADDWELDLTLELASGEFWIVQPGRLPGYEWRAGGTPAELFVETRSPGRPPEVLARRPSGGSKPRAQRLSLIKRGSGVSFRVDNRPLAATPLALPERLRNRVGLVAYAANGDAVSIVHDLSLKVIPYRWRPVSAAPEAGELAQLIASADGIAGLSPPWARLEGSGIREAPFDQDLFKILAHRYAWDVIPTVAIEGDAAPGPATTEWIARLPERVRREGWAGVRLDFASVPPTARGAWDPIVRELGAGLRRSGGRLVRETP